MKQFKTIKLLFLIMIFSVLLLTGCNTNNHKSSTSQENISNQNISSEIKLEESENSLENEVPFYETLTIRGAPYKLITYLGARISKPEAILTINYDKTTKKVSAVSIEILHYNSEEDTLNDMAILKGDDMITSAIYNETVQKRDDFYSIVGDVDLKAPFEQYILTWFIEQQDVTALKRDYDDRVSNYQDPAEFEEGENYIYHPLMELRVEWK